MTQEHIERRYTVTGAAVLTVANISGTVDIQAGDEGVITVDAVKHDDGDAEHTRVEIKQDDKGAVSIKTDYGESVWRFFGQRPCSVDYIVRAPRNTSLQLKCVSSASTVKGLTGKFDINTISGDSALSDLSGPMTLNLVSARLSGEKLSGITNVSTVSGDVVLTGGNFPTLKLNTVSGAVTVDTPLANGPYEFHSVSGDTKLIVQTDAGCTVDFSTLSGRLTSNLPTTHSEQSGRNRHVVLQNGGANVKFDSISAGLTIVNPRKTESATVGVSQNVLADPAMPMPPMPPSAAAPDIPTTAIDSAVKARREILDRVAKGTLSVDDAVNLLRG